MSPCPVCIERQANLGDPSEARWIGPDGVEYCSLHFIQRFGHAEPLVRVEGYKAPTQRKAPAPKAPPAPKQKVATEVKS